MPSAKSSIRIEDQPVVNLTVTSSPFFFDMDAINLAPVFLALLWPSESFAPIPTRMMLQSGVHSVILLPFFPSKPPDDSASLTSDL